MSHGHMTCHMATCFALIHFEDFNKTSKDMNIRLQPTIFFSTSTCSREGSRVPPHVYRRAWVRVCMRICVRLCVRLCVFLCVCVCVRVYVCWHADIWACT